MAMIDGKQVVDAVIVGTAACRSNEPGVFIDKLLMASATKNDEEELLHLLKTKVATPLLMLFMAQMNSELNRRKTGLKKPRPRECLLEECETVAQINGYCYKHWVYEARRLLKAKKYF